MQIAICTIGVYVYVKRLDERTLRYRQPTKAHHFCSSKKNDTDTTTRTTRMISTTTTTQLPPRSAAKQQARDPAAADENGDNDDDSASSSSDDSAIPLPTEAPVRMQSLDQSHQAMIQGRLTRPRPKVGATTVQYPPPPSVAPPLVLQELQPAQSSLPDLLVRSSSLPRRRDNHRHQRRSRRRFSIQDIDIPDEATCRYNRIQRKTRNSVLELLDETASDELLSGRRSIFASMALVCEEEDGGVLLDDEERTNDDDVCDETEDHTSPSTIAGESAHSDVVRGGGDGEGGGPAAAAGTSASSAASAENDATATSLSKVTMVTRIQSKVQQWNKQREIYRDDYPRTIDVLNQAIWYLGVFYVTHIWSTSNRLVQMLNLGSSKYGLIMMHSFFDPFQGFLNYVVYQRPRYLFIRKSQPELGRVGAIKRALQFSYMKQRDVTRQLQDRKSVV